MTAGRARLIAHRGASAHAPENTFAAFGLALRLGADGIEHDLQVTKDGVLVCLHDQTLDRTTDARRVFPSRASIERREPEVDGAWFAHDFTSDEVAALDAGSWFGPAFAGARVPTFDELLDWARGRTSLWTEIKNPDAYEARGIDVMSLVEEAWRRHGLDRARHVDLPLTLLSFHERTIRRAAARCPAHVARLQLVDCDAVDAWCDARRLARTAAVAGWIGPNKDGLDACPKLARLAHEQGLQVAPWTYRSGAGNPPDRAGADMARHLRALHVDAVITDHPDQFPDESRDPG